jgi:hypothetical protein
MESMRCAISGVPTRRPAECAGSASFSGTPWMKDWKVQLCGCGGVLMAGSCMAATALA